MNTQMKNILLAIAVGINLLLAGTAWAHNPDGSKVASLIKPTATTIVLDGIEGTGEWDGATTLPIESGMGNPLNGTVKTLHKADGIYLLITINDSTSNFDDAVQIHFDINHNGVLESSDFGVEIRSGGQAKWGNPDPSLPDPFDSSGWSVISAPNIVGLGLRTGTNWTVEFRLPDGTSGLSLSTMKSVGIYFMIYDIDQVLGPVSAKYAQWPKPPAASPDVLLASTPQNWGDYVLDPKLIFPDLAITGVRRHGATSADDNTINYTGTNSFEVKIKNPGGTVLPDAAKVRVNLYLAARGIGESWHRIDEADVLDADCVASWPSASNLPQADVCSGTASLGDITTQNLLNVVMNSAKYTIKKGIPMSRVGSNLITISPSGTSPEPWIPILDWNTAGDSNSSLDQDKYFKDFKVTIGNVEITYQRGHQCMLAEALFADDPNPGNNTMQVNMDFVGVPGTRSLRSFFTLGWAGFSKYDPIIGKDMFLQVVRKNMNPVAGWEYQLEGVESLREDVFVAKLKGEQSLPVELALTAPPVGILGKPLKENLMVPPKAGGRHENVRMPSGEPPVYVKVESGSTLLIANYYFSENDPQQVDLDGEGNLLPANGPTGLSSSYLEKFLQKVGEKFGLLLVPHAPLGALVGSFDNFRTGFLVAEGVQVKAPEGAKYLALGINGLAGLYNDNTGTGFRVKVTQLSGGNPEHGMLEASMQGLVSEAFAQSHNELQIVPIGDVVPTLCINGYEKIDQTSTIAGKPYELLRYIGNVCWGVINVFPQDRSDQPDQGDLFDETKEELGTDGPHILIFVLGILLLIIMILWRRGTFTKVK